jgi:hypothetical protein
MYRARAAGIRAARADEPRTACPYRPDGSTARERMLCRAWLTGYGTVRPMPVDYSA